MPDEQEAKNPVNIQQKSPFKKKFKKLFSHEQMVVENAIRTIIADPKIGEKKVGDLAKTYVYKFKIETQEYLLAYTFDEDNLILEALGVHENFYRDLKRKR